MTDNGMRPGVRAEAPEEERPPRAGRPATVAGGVPAVVSATRHALGRIGVLRGLRTMGRANQRDGFDCPGCAWPEPTGERSFAEFCENGAKAIADEATTRKAGPELFRRFGVAELSERSDYWLGQQGRLVRPMLLRQGSHRYEEVSWEEAYGLVAAELNALASPDEAVFYTSGRTSNEAAFLYQLFVRQYGTNNLPDCSNMCHESSGVALTEAVGIGKGSVTLDDFTRAELILVIGQNPGTCHPRMLSALEDAVRAGARIVAVNPLAEVGLSRFKQPQDLTGPVRAVGMLAGRGTRLADLHVPVRVNGDVAFLKGVMKELVAADAAAPGSAVMRTFIDARTVGFDAFVAALDEVGWEAIEEESGIGRDTIREVARRVAAAERIIATWAMGLTQHRNAVANIQEIVNLLLLRGSIGKPGAGLCPVRGHSNVQGDRTMGIWERPRPEFLDRLGEVFGFDPPRDPGFDTVGAIRGMAEGRVGVFFALGGNFLSAAPDTALTARALGRCRLTVQVSTKLNRSHLVTGEQALILPCLGRTDIHRTTAGDQFATVENSMGIVHRSQGHLEPPGALPSEVEIVAQIAARTLGSRSAVPWLALATDLDRVRDLIEQVIPGFERFNERVRRPNGFALPNIVREGRFGTPDGRARFTVHPLSRSPLGPDELMLMTVRSHDQFNTSVYGLDDRYRGIRGGRRVVFMNAADLADRSLGDGALVDLVAGDGDRERVAPGFRAVVYEIPRRCAAAYFPEANVLVSIDSVAAGSNTPASKSVPIRVRPAAAS
jgi:molybdopterin-dependent oxidoreductase alpha subunit